MVAGQASQGGRLFGAKGSWSGTAVAYTCQWFRCDRMSLPVARRHGEPSRRERRRSRSAPVARPTPVGDDGRLEPDWPDRRTAGPASTAQPTSPEVGEGRSSSRRAMEPCAEVVQLPWALQRLGACVADRRCDRRDACGGTRRSRSCARGVAGPRRRGVASRLQRCDRTCRQQRQRPPHDADEPVKVTGPSSSPPPVVAFVISRAGG